ncbi:acyl-CoA carboxylase subunit beta [Candidatus Riflebacteria bacterium]
MDTLAEKFENLREKRKKANEGGGPQRQAAQKAKGKMTVRERIEILVDPGSFLEFDKFATHNCHDFNMHKNQPLGDGVVTGLATIDGRTICLFAQDFTIFGGSLGEIYARKICKIMDFAVKNGYPVLGLNDSAGARIQEGVVSLGGYAEIFYRNTCASGVIPQISAVFGPCAGGAVYSPAITDFIIMTKQTSHMFITGPDVIKAVTNEEVSFEELGGAMTHNSKSGVADFACDDEIHTIETIKRLFSYIPSNNLEDSPVQDRFKAPDVKDEILDSIVPANPNKPYEMKDLINAIVDCNSFFEIGEHFAANIVIGFARIEGRSLGVIANNPNHLAGCLDISASIKAARFIRFCDAFNIPILSFVDVPGFLPGTLQEHGGIIKHGAKLLYAYCETTVPKVTVITRKAYGGAYDVMCSKHIRADVNFAWPTAEIAVMGAAGATRIIYRNQIKEAQNPEEKEKELKQDYEDNFANPYQAASRCYVDEIIFPSETRQRLVHVYKILEGKREARPARKHGNIPL